MFWSTTRFQIDLSRPRVMGIVNVTPDSFSDGGQHHSTHGALAHAEQLLREGADMLDIGGESSRPGAPALSAEEEWRRVGEVLKAAMSLGCPVSLDTYKGDTMRRALDLGVDIINDIRALREPGAEDAVAAHANCGICLMHMAGSGSSDMQQHAQFTDVVTEVSEFLQARAERLQARGVAPARLVLDPGIGFGKTPDHNLALLRGQAALTALGYPLLVGWSRKSTLGLLTGRAVSERLAASLAAALAAVHQGARVLRVHDVASTVDVLKVWDAAGLSRQ